MSLCDQDGMIWVDGEYVAFREAKVHILTHTLHYGVGVFEGIRAYETDNGSAIFRLQEHTDRLYRSAHILDMKMPYDKDQLFKVQQEIMTKNQLKAAYIRPMAFYGAQYLGLQTSQLETQMMVAAWPWGSYFNAEDLERGIRVQTSSYTRHHVNSVSCKAKANGNYLNSIIALQEARHNGYDEALMMDTYGFISEGSSANVFIVKDGALHTPTTTSILEGITRSTIMTLAKDLGYEIIERNITRDEIYTADEMFFTGSAAEVTAVSCVDSRQIGCGKRGPITAKLQQLYHEVVHGKHEQYQEWLCYC